MRTVSWQNFIATHPQRAELQRQAAGVANLLNPFRSVTENMNAIIATNSTIIVTLDPFNHQPTPHFYHHQANIPVPGQRVHLIALQGFGAQAIPIEIDTHLFSATPRPITCPSLADYLSFHDKTIDDLKTITTTANNRHHIRRSAVLPPSLGSLVMASRTSCPWTMLYQAIAIINQQRPENAADPTDLTFAQPFINLFNTLWAFTRDTDETRSMAHPARSIASDDLVTKWCESIHTQCLSPSDPDPDANSHTNSDIVNGIDRIAQNLELQANERYAQIEEKNNKSSKWKKLDETLKKTILFASTTGDGSSAPSEPTARMINLIQCTNGTVAANLFKAWHPQTMIIQMGMATNISKGMMVSSDGPFAINTFSPFFTPSSKAGHKHISNYDINTLQLLSSSNNLSQKDITKLLHSEPFVPSAPHLYIDQVENFHRVLSDVFGKEAIITEFVEELCLHFHANSDTYYTLFAEDPNFPVWILNQVHYKTQQILHKCSSADDVNDVPFHSFSFDEEMKAVIGNNVHSRRPRWYSDWLESKNPSNSNPNKREYDSPPSDKDKNRNKKKGTVTNQNVDRQVKIKEGESYRWLIHHSNLEKCKSTAVKINNVDICNNFHIRGWCHSACKRSASHKKLPNDIARKYQAHVKNLRENCVNYDDADQNSRDSSSQNRGED